MTVSEALAAHACAQIAAAKNSDQMRNTSTAPMAKGEARSFIDSWAFQATVIGWTKAAN